MEKHDWPEGVEMRPGLNIKVLQDSVLYGIMVQEGVMFTVRATASQEIEVRWEIVLPIPGETYKDYDTQITKPGRLLSGGIDLP